MVDIEQRNRQKMRPVARVEKLVQKFENHSVLAPPPIHFKAPPTPPPVEHLENTSGKIIFYRQIVTNSFSSKIRARKDIRV